MVSGGQSKIGEFAGHSLVSHQNVLRLEVPVVDSNGVAVLNGIQDLEESPLGKGIITNVLALFGDVGEQVTLWAILNDNVCAVRGVHNLYQRNNIGMSTGLVVELDLPLLELLLSGLQGNLVQSIDRIRGVGLDIDRGVDYAIGTNS